MNIVVSKSNKVYAKCPKKLQKNVETGLSYFDNNLPQTKLFYNVSENKDGEIAVTLRKKSTAAAVKDFFEKQKPSITFEKDNVGPGFGRFMFYSFEKLQRVLQLF